MSYLNFADWVPVETGSDVLQRVQQASAIESFARGESMSTDVKEVPASGGFVMGVGAKGSVLAEDDSTATKVLLTARKIRAGVRIAEEDLEDSVANIVNAKSLDWATSYAKFLDNACLGTTAAANGTTVPFNSAYKVAADASRVLLAEGVVSYDDLNDVLSSYEVTDYFNNDRTAAIAHPAFKAALRGVKDEEGRPIFVPGAGLNPDTLFDYPVVWTTGARTHATATQSPEGNPLLVVGNLDFMIRGDRSNPEFRLDYQELTDEQILQGRSRKAFAIGNPLAIAVLELGDES